MSINNILTPAGTTTLRSYRHAARIFVDDNFRLSPKYGFLFYVEFDFNPLITNVSNTAAQELGMIVKKVVLPKYTLDVKVLNAYNRKNIVQNKIGYDPITITFHDDQSDNVRNFWYDYYSFFYRDSDYADATYGGVHKYQSRPSFDWGYSPRPTVGYNNANGNQPYQYIQAIRIYSLYQKNFSEYELINPIISSFSHGEHANTGDAALVEHTMVVNFETVKYYTGYTTADTVGGYIDLHYDNTPSPIAPKDGVNLVDNGQGGYTNAPDTITDLAGTNPLYGINNIATPFFNIGSFGTSFGSTLGAATALSAGAGVNIGGFTIPSLGSLTSGLNNGVVLRNQIAAAAAGLAGSAAGTLANGVLSGVTQGLGANGTAIVGLAAQAIANPSAALAMVEQMALKYATAQASALVGQGVNYILTGPDGKGGLIGTISTNINSALTTLNQTAGTVFGEGLTFTQGFGQSWSNLFNGFGFNTNAGLISQQAAQLQTSLATNNSNAAARIFEE
jgi:hypothetical protein